MGHEGVGPFFLERELGPSALRGREVNRLAVTAGRALDVGAVEDRADDVEARDGVAALPACLAAEFAAVDRVAAVARAPPATRRMMRLPEPVASEAGEMALAGGATTRCERGT